VSLAPAWTLHHGDCLAGMATLPDRSVDVVITDPPFSDHVHKKIRSGRNGGQAGISAPVALDFAHLSDATMTACAEHFARLSRRWVLVFSDVESTHLWRAAIVVAGLEYIRTGIWRKTVHTPQFTGDRPAPGYETFVLAHRKGRKRWNGGGRSGVYDFASEGQGAHGAKRVHETQKPLALMDALVRDFTERGELVLDPFAGSGTTGAACVRAGRRFVGWEQDERYHALASRRLDATREQFALFEERP
jgi:site-specific DNA-methyltransferase (adenine-specific)